MGPVVLDLADQGIHLTDQHTSQASFDADGNGVSELSLEKFLYELRFVSLRDDGIIWLRVIPVSADLAEMSLPVLIDAYVDSMSGGRFDAAWVDRNHTTGREKHYASVLTAPRRATIWIR